MQDFIVNLVSPAPSGFRSIKAAQSVDLNISEKLTHRFRVQADIKTDFNVGLIIGASGSGKTTLALQMFGEAVFETLLDLSRPVIEQFDKSMSYEDCVNALTGIGLSQVACWIKPAGALSNGQKARAEAALQMCSGKEFIAMDEFTSVVDRDVAKAMAFCVQRFARKQKKRIVLISCHYDVFEWLNPDWVIDCNKETFLDRRLESLGYKRTETIKFEIAECKRDSWHRFSKYHYLSDKLPGGHIETFGIYLDGRQIGFQCFANYVPHRKGTKKIMHSNRTVVHPDYVGFGLGMKVIDATSHEMKRRGYDVQAKFSSVPIYQSMSKNPLWRLSTVSNNVHSSQKEVGKNMSRNTGFRVAVRTYSFKFVG